ncbi:CRISPR-associated endonuclease Cas6 [Methanosarcina sp. WWM596]|uniref:CRISPR-associated endonuclease Cas6 n=1 Tax=Methanosarcina sp. WWM596 TaxID=1434103 RepID=UPI00061597D8|nr:CRISPR-associated endonuclease Cas6 [Methanosarcina sp. WWM596]AKB19476.1 hypothetical protein MSWHS_2613 [Methanosarcina sp. WWM596]
MNPENIKLKTLEMTFEGTEEFRGDANQIRGFFASKFNEYDQLHNHNTDSFYYRYPLVQYKVLDRIPIIVGVNEGAEILKGLFDKFDTVTLPHGDFEITERSMRIKKQDFGLTKGIYFYEFLTPWLALNKENEEKFFETSNSGEQKEILRRTLIGNLLSMSKTFGYTVPDTIKCDVDMELRRSKYKGMDFISFNGGFMANFLIPDFLGIGKGVAKGFGTVRMIRF